VGLTPFAAAPEEKFDAQKHRVHGMENPPAEALIAETLAPGMTFQGRLLRPVLVRLQTAHVPAAEPVQEPPVDKSEATEAGQLALEAD
jgi:hypothetical protein